MSFPQAVPKKIIAVGDGGCGKTSLLMMFARNKFEEQCFTVTSEIYDDDMQIDNVKVQLVLWDTQGQYDYDELRSIHYPGTDVALICFSLVWRASFEHVLSKWVPELHHFCPNVPVLLVGTKTDLRHDKETLEMSYKMKNPIVKESEGHDLAKKIGAIGYVECSAKTNHNVQNVFRMAVEATLNKRTERRKTNCSFL